MVPMESISSLGGINLPTDEDDNPYITDSMLQNITGPAYKGLIEKYRGHWVRDEQNRKWVLDKKIEVKRNISE